MRFPIVVLLLIGLASVAGPAPAQAMQPAADAAPVADSAGMTCSNVERLAGVVAAEASDAQPLRARVAVAQIVAREAASRGMDVCTLSEQTFFVSVWHYAQARPLSWTARQLSDPPAWSLGLARDVLAGRWPDATEGANHFDGVATPFDVMVIGTVHFQP